MKAPFALPVRLVPQFPGHCLVAADAELIAGIDSANPAEQRFIVHALNHYDRLAAAIKELAAASDAEMAARGGPALAHHFELRRLLDAKRAIAQLAKELP